jgi:dienelactone hydrolase
MDINRILIKGKDFNVPAVMITPQAPSGAAVIVPGYGGSKEEMLGFAFRMAETGVAACAIDLRGQGEHELSFGDGVILDLEAALGYCRKFGKTAAIGHSMGGRLALLSTADYRVGISPALPRTYTEHTMSRVLKSRKVRVRSAKEAMLFEMFERLEEWIPKEKERALIIYGSNDIPEIMEACEKMRRQGVETVKVDGVSHPDSFLVNDIIRMITARLKKWMKEEL